MENTSIKNIKLLTLVAMVTALSVVLRIFSSTFLVFLPNFQPVTVIIIFISFSMGSVLGVMHSTLVIFVTNLILGMGYWTITQIISYGVIALLASFLAKILKNKNEKVMWFIFATFSFASGYIYGFIISLLEVYIFSTKSFLPYYLAGIPFDTIHAVGNLIFFIVLYPTLFNVINNEYRKIVYKRKNRISKKEF